MTHKSLVNFPEINSNFSSQFRIEKKHASSTNITNISFHRHSRALPTIAQSFSSSESQFGHNIDFDSKMKYLDSYKNLKKITEMRKHHLQPQTPISSYLSKLNESSLIPLPMGLIRKQGVCERLDTSDLSMGNNYAEAMAEGLKSLKVRKIILRNNGLSDKAAAGIVNNLDPRYSTEVNLAENHIGLESVNAIAKLNSNPVSKLQIINLEGNSLGDKNIGILCNSLSTSDRIRELILSNNKISHDGAVSLSNYIRYSSYLQRLDLSWNNIRGEGANFIITALTENEGIMVMDLSWNSLSSHAEENCSKALSDLFRINSHLIHLDISQNMLCMQDCEILAKGLNENRTLLGLHVEGNHAEIDSQGNLHVRDSIDTSTSLNNSRIIHKCKALKRKNKNCWICQKWNEVGFRWRNGKSGTYGEEPVMVHLDFERYCGYELKEESDSWYKLTRMCPPGTVYFFFSLKGFITTSTEYNVVEKGINYLGVNYHKVNMIEVRPSPGQLWLVLKPLSKPRDITFHKEESPPWDFSNSVFRGYISDMPILLNDCYLEDMESSKIRELTDKEYEYILQYLKQFYPSIKETYKYLASKAWLDWDTWLEILIEFTSQNNIINQKDLKAYDIENIIKTFRYWNSTTDIYFARYQFLELIVRISIMKYYRNRKATKISQAVKLFFKHHSSAFDTNSSQDFRVEKLYTQMIDKILYKHQNVLIKLYYYFANDNNLTLDGFYKLIQPITKEYAIIQCSFILSKETSATYSYYDNSLKYVEFLEALVRVIDTYKQNTNQHAKLDLFLDEIIEVRLEPLLNSINNELY